MSTLVERTVPFVRVTSSVTADGRVGGVGIGWIAVGIGWIPVGGSPVGRVSAGAITRLALPPGPPPLWRRHRVALERMG